jgi:ParB/RepB/Spo0J family partition protein
VSLKDTELLVPIARFGERLSQLRLREAAALEAMRRSLSRHGQLTPVVAFQQGDQLEILDGFKRLHAARTLGWSGVSAKMSEVDFVEAKIQLVALHDRRGLTEIEEAWLVRSLYRDDGLSQPEIAWRLARHKSWVCRRLLLVEALDPAVQAEVRLGLIVPRAAVTLAQLPRGNQRSASAVVIRRGLTVRQTELFVAELLEQPDEAARAEWIARRLESEPKPAGPSPTREKRSEADWMASDVATLLRVAARLQARLLATSLGALGAPAVEIIVDGLVALRPVLSALGATLTSVIGRERKA